MYRRRRVTSAALALAAVLVASACTEADNGNNTLAGVSQQPEVTSAAPTPTEGAATTPPAGGGDGEIKLEAKDNEFVPKDITAKAGTINILMDNTGVAPHTFTNKDLGVDVNANGGEQAKIKIENAKPGTYTFICIYHEALKMVGELTVT